MTETRICKKCNTEKPIEEFSKIKSKNLVKWQCKACDVERLKKWVKENPDKKKKADEKYYQKNKERLIEYSAKWQKENHGDFRVRVRGYVKTIPPWYANQLLNTTYVNGVRQISSFLYPVELIQAKQIQMKINRLIKEKQKCKR